MKQVELYGRVRYAVKIQGMSRREAARMFGIDRRTVDKMLVFSIRPQDQYCIIEAARSPGCWSE